MVPREISCTVTSRGGGVKVLGVTGAHELTSSVGSVHLFDIHGDVDAESHGGGVRIEGEAGRVKAKSSGGSVHVDIDGLDQEMYLKSGGGGVKAVIQNGEKLGLDLDLKSTKVNIELENFSGQVEKNLVKGSMNDGGIPVYMRTSGGNISVLFEE